MKTSNDFGKKSPKEDSKEGRSRKNKPEFLFHKIYVNKKPLLFEYFMPYNVLGIIHILCICISL